MKAIVPRNIKVIYAKSVLIINVPRRLAKIDYSNLIRPQYDWMRIPRAYAGIDKINNQPIDVNHVLSIQNVDFQLQSAIKLDVDSLNTSNNDQLIIGTSCILVTSNSRTANTLDFNQSHLLYDPKRVLEPLEYNNIHGGVNPGVSLSMTLSIQLRIWHIQVQD